MLSTSTSCVGPLRQSVCRCSPTLPIVPMAVSRASISVLSRHVSCSLRSSQQSYANNFSRGVAAAAGKGSKGFGAASKEASSAPQSTAQQPANSSSLQGPGDDANSQQGVIYARPDLYDAAFSYRDFKEEAKFLRDVYNTHAGSAALNSVLDLGCGPSRHLLGLAKSGVPTCVGIDLSDSMLAYARSLVEKAGLKNASTVTLQQGDMTNFSVDGKEGSFDLAMCLLGTFSHLTENEQAAAAFRCVHRHLRPGGLFMLELAHPGDLFDGTLIVGDGAKEVWEVPQGKDKKLLVEWGAEFDNFDPETQVLYRTVSINVFKGEDVQDSIEEVVPYRQYTVQELGLLCMLSGLRIEALYGEMRLECGLNHEEAYRMVAVMRKV